MPNMKVGTNGQACVQDFQPSKADNTDEMENGIEPASTRSQNNISTEVGPACVERVGVVVSVPQELVEKKFGIGNVKKLFGWPIERQPANMLDTKFASLKCEIIEKIRPLLPVASFDHADRYPISILLEENELKRATSWAADLQSIVSDHWPTLTVLVVGLMMLMLVTRTNGKTTQQTASKSLSIDSEAIESPESIEEQQQRTEAERKLSQLIEQDPDAAAEVIKSWIRKKAA